MNLKWNSEDDKILIDFVRIHDELYNIKCKDYRNTQFKQKLWSEIGAVLNKTDLVLQTIKFEGYSDCSKRWCYVRDYYIRRKGKPGTGSSGEAAKKRADLLSFLDSHRSSQRNSITNFVEHEYQGNESEITPNTQDKGEETQSHNLDITYDDSENDYKLDSKHDDDVNKTTDCNAYSKIKYGKKQKNKQIAQQKPTQYELDETDLFFSYMAKIVKKLPRYEQAHLRMQIGTIVGNAELRCISRDSPQSSEFSPRPNTSANAYSKIEVLSPRASSASDFSEMAAPSPSSTIAQDDQGQIFLVSNDTE